MGDIADMPATGRNKNPSCWRPLICPICGANVRVPVPDTNFPEIHRLPDHDSANGMNLCGGVVVTVTLDFDKCAKCGGGMCKHPSGLCRICFGKDKNAQAESLKRIDSL
jgi:rRNA maturation protein Nop10